MRTRTAVLAVTLVLGSAAAHAELLVSSNDGHQPPEPGQSRAPDSISVIDFTNGTAKVLGSVAAPASVIGPPMAVVVAPNEKWALVTAGTKADPADQTKTALDDVVSVIDLSTPAHPRVAQTLHAGQGVSAIAINRAATLALAANMNEDSVSIFSIANGTLTPAGKLQLDAGTRPASITFLPDGKSAFLMGQGGAGMLHLAVNGTAVTVAGPVGGIRATISVLTPDGKFAIINGAPPPPPPAAAAPAIAAGVPVAAAAPAAGRGAGGGRGPGGPGRAAPQASLLDLSSGTVVATAPLGAGPEYIGLSSDGAYLAATITNGSHNPPTSPGYNDFGLLRIYKVSATALTPVAEAHTGHWCQAAIWSKDSRTLVLQCAVEKEIEVFRFDGASALTQDPAAALKFDAGPASMATASSR